MFTTQWYPLTYNPNIHWTPLICNSEGEFSRELRPDFLRSQQLTVPDSLGKRKNIGNGANSSDEKSTTRGFTTGPYILSMITLNYPSNICSGLWFWSMIRLLDGWRKNWSFQNHSIFFSQHSFPSRRQQFSGVPSVGFGILSNSVTRTIIMQSASVHQRTVSGGNACIFIWRNPMIFWIDRYASEWLHLQLTQSIKIEVLGCNKKVDTYVGVNRES